MTMTMMPTMMTMMCFDVHFSDDDNFHTVWHLTRSQYGCQWFWIGVSGVENWHFFCTLCLNFGLKFGLETGKRLCYEDLLLLEFRQCIMFCFSGSFVEM